MHALEGRRILFVLPPSRFDERQFYQSWQLLADEGAWLVAASSTTTGVAVGEGGAQVHTLLLDTRTPRDVDALVLIEGHEEVSLSLERAGGAVAAALGAGRAVAAFGKLGAELQAAGFPVIRDGRGLERLLAELTVRIGRQPRATVEATGRTG